MCLSSLLARLFVRIASGNSQMAAGIQNVVILTHCFALFYWIALTQEWHSSHKPCNIISWIICFMSSMQDCCFIIVIGCKVMIWCIVTFIALNGKEYWCKIVFHCCDWLNWRNHSKKEISMQNCFALLCLIALQRTLHWHQALLCILWWMNLAILVRLLNFYDWLHYHDLLPCHKNGIKDCWCTFIIDTLRCYYWFQCQKHGIDKKRELMQVCLALLYWIALLQS